MDFLLSHPNGNIFFLLSFRTRLHRVRNLLHRGVDKSRFLALLEMTTECLRDRAERHLVRFSGYKCPASPANAGVSALVQRCVTLHQVVVPLSRTVLCFDA